MKVLNQKFALTKNRIIIIALLAFTVALCSIFAFAGNSNEAEDALSEASSLADNASSEVEAKPLENIQGIGIYVDGCFVAAVSDVSEAEAAFADALSKRVVLLGILDSGAEVNNSIEYVEGMYPENSFSSFKIDAVNGEITAYDGSSVNAKFAVRTVHTYTEEVVVDHDIKVIYTDALPDGATKVVNKGIDGEGVKIHSVVYVDGVEQSRDATLEVLTAPVDKTVKVGSRGDGKLQLSMGTFIKPYDGFITSYVGSRWGRTHKGIDIVAYEGSCFRDPAVAAANGVVIKAEYYGGYGNCVVIDHGNGITSYYAHFDKICVKAGDKVSAGDVVGLIGSTGNSTGNHLHFEIRINDEVVNPLLFVDYE